MKLGRKERTFKKKKVEINIKDLTTFFQSMRSLNETDSIKLALNSRKTIDSDFSVKLFAKDPVYPDKPRPITVSASVSHFNNDIYPPYLMTPASKKSLQKLVFASSQKKSSEKRSDSKDKMKERRRKQQENRQIDELLHQIKQEKENERKRLREMKEGTERAKSMAEEAAVEEARRLREEEFERKKEKFSELEAALLKERFERGLTDARRAIQRPKELEERFRAFDEKQRARELEDLERIADLVRRRNDTDQEVLRRTLEKRREAEAVQILLEKERTLRKEEFVEKKKGLKAEIKKETKEQRKRLSAAFMEDQEQRMRRMEEIEAKMEEMEAESKHRREMTATLLREEAERREYERLLAKEKHYDEDEDWERQEEEERLRRAEEQRLKRAEEEAERRRAVEEQRLKRLEAERLREEARKRQVEQDVERRREAEENRRRQDEQRAEQQRQREQEAERLRLLRENEERERQRKIAVEEAERRRIAEENKRRQDEQRAEQQRQREQEAERLRLQRENEERERQRKIAEEDAERQRIAEENRRRQDEQRAEQQRQREQEAERLRLQRENEERERQRKIAEEDAERQRIADENRRRQEEQRAEQQRQREQEAERLRLQRENEERDRQRRIAEDEERRRREDEQRIKREEELAEQKRKREEQLRREQEAQARAAEEQLRIQRQQEEEIRLAEEAEARRLAEEAQARLVEEEQRVRQAQELAYRQLQVNQEELRRRMQETEVRAAEQDPPDKPHLVVIEGNSMDFEASEVRRLEKERRDEEELEDEDLEEEDEEVKEIEKTKNESVIPKENFASNVFGKDVESEFEGDEEAERLAEVEGDDIDLPQPEIALNPTRLAFVEKYLKDRHFPSVKPQDLLSLSAYEALLSVMQEFIRGGTLFFDVQVGESLVMMYKEFGEAREATGDDNEAFEAIGPRMSNLVHAVKSEVAQLGQSVGADGSIFILFGSENPFKFEMLELKLNALVVIYYFLDDNVDDEVQEAIGLLTELVWSLFEAVFDVKFEQGAEAVMAELTHSTRQILEEIKDAPPYVTQFVLLWSILAEPTPEDPDEHQRGRIVDITEAKLDRAILSYVLHEMITTTEGYLDHVHAYFSGVVDQLQEEGVELVIHEAPLDPADEASQMKLEVMMKELVTALLQRPKTFALFQVVLEEERFSYYFYVDKDRLLLFYLLTHPPEITQLVVTSCALYLKKQRKLELLCDSARNVLFSYDEETTLSIFANLVEREGITPEQAIAILLYNAAPYYLDQELLEGEEELIE